MIRLRSPLMTMALVGVTVLPAPTHAEGTLTGGTTLPTWPPTANIIIPTALVTLIYVPGMLRHAAVTEPIVLVAPCVVLRRTGSGLLALQSPIGPAAERLFSVRQVQHLLLCMIGRMLIATARPHGILVAGLLFWWRVFDRRPAPQGVSYSVPLLMLWLVILLSILLSACTTLKDTALYGAYDGFDRLFNYAPLADEQIGDIFFWISSGMMCVVAVHIVIQIWGRHEKRLDQKYTIWSPWDSDALPFATSDSALIEQARLKNPTLALGFATFVNAVFTRALLISIPNNLSDISNTEIETSDVRIQHVSHGDVPFTLR